MGGRRTALGPDTAGCGSWSGTGCWDWNRHGGSQTGMLGVSPHHAIDLGTNRVLKCSLQRDFFPGSPLIQGPFRKNFRVLKHKPITPQGPRGPSGAEGCTWPLLSSRAHGGIRTWLGGGRGRASSSPGTPSPPVSQPRAFLVPRASVSPPCMHRQASRTAMSWLLAGSVGGSREGVHARGCFLPMSLPKTSSFFSLGMHCGGSLSSVPPRQRVFYPLDSPGPGLPRVKP